MIITDINAPTKQYNLVLKPFQKFIVACPLVTIAASLFLYVSIKTESGQRLPLLVLIVWLFILIMDSVWLFRLPLRIDIFIDGHIRIVSTILSREIWMRDIISIERTTFRINSVKLTYAYGALRITRKFKGFDEFLNDIRYNNPSVKITGC
jgi:hypothetical protein